MDNGEVTGPYCDLDTGNVVYQVAEWPEGLKWNGKEGVSVDRDHRTFTSAEMLRESAKSTKTPFSKDWYEEEVESARNRETPNALRLFVELFSGGLIEGKTPHEVLDIEPDADVLEAHKAWKRLSKLMHPDSIHARVLELRQQFLKGMEPNGGLMGAFSRFLKPMEEAMNVRTDALADEQLAKLSKRKRTAYIKKHKEALRRASESERLLFDRWDELERELVAKAGHQMSRLNQAYDAIKKGWGEGDFVGVSSLWGRHEWRLPEDNEHVFHIEDRIPLNGDGYLYRELDYHREGDEFVVDKVGMAELHCATGRDRLKDIYIIQRIAIPLKVLFAFLELRDGKVIHPALLTDLAEEYGLDAVQTEELRLMLTQRCDAETICKTFVKAKEEPSEWWGPDEIDDGPVYLPDRYGSFAKWINMILDGPRYDWYEDYDYGQDGPGGLFGIEYGRSGSLIILLPCQKDRWNWRADTLPIERIVFPAEDVAVMKQIAYSRSLGGKRKEPILIG